MWSQICSSSKHSVGNWWNMQTKVSQTDSHNIRYPLYFWTFHAVQDQPKAAVLSHRWIVFGPREGGKGLLGWAIMSARSAPVSRVTKMTTVTALKCARRYEVTATEKIQVQRLLPSIPFVSQGGGCGIILFQNCANQPHKTFPKRMLLSWQLHPFWKGFVRLTGAIPKQSNSTAAALA